MGFGLAMDTTREFIRSSICFNLDKFHKPIHHDLASFFTMVFGCCLVSYIFLWLSGNTSKRRFTITGICSLSQAERLRRL